MIIAFWLEGVADQGRDPVALSVVASISATGSMGCAPRRAIISTASPRDLTLAQSAMLAGMVQAPSRLAPTRNLAGAQKRSRLVLQEMADTGVISAGARAGDALGAAGGASRARSRPAPISPTGSRPRRAAAFEADYRRGQGARRRSTPTSSGSRSARSPMPGSARRRRRWWRCAPTAASWRWSAGKSYKAIARSTAPPRRGASRDRRSNCSSISPRCAPATRPTT